MNNQTECSHFCDRCGRETNGDNYTVFDGELLCDDCLNEATTVCSHCGERIWCEDNAGSDEMPLCDGCYDNYYTLIATLELVDRICEYAVIYSDEELRKISWTEFVTSLDEDACGELITYLKERRLYVNPPITNEEDE